MLALAIVVAGFDTAAAQSRPPLFSPASSPRDASAAARSGAVRTRVVAARGDLLDAALDPAAPEDAPFLLNLFDDRAFALRRVRVDAATPGHRTWVGTSGASDEVVAALTLGPDGLSGGITAHGVAYALEADAAGAVVVRELAPTLPRELPAQVVAPRAGGRTDRALDQTAAAPRIDVLVLYTAAARARAGGTAAVQAALANAVAVTNAALQRSAVSATLATVGLQEIPYPESPNGLVADLSALAAGGVLHAGVEALRVAAGADLVALVVGRATANSGCGVAYLGPAPTAIYSVTEEACLFAGQWSFTHEVGHNFGADHAPGDPVVSPVPYARGYRDDVIRTLMAYAVSGSPPRLLNFSSSSVREPAVTGLPTGNSLQDNARRLAETAATVAAFSAAATPPETPTALAASVTGSTVSLSWSPPAGGGPVQGYVLEAGPTPGSTVWGPFGTPTPAVTFGGVAAGRYYVRVRSVGPGATSAPTPDLAVDVGPACSVPGPAVVSATVAPGIATLRWSAPAGTGPTSYDVGLSSAPDRFDLGIFAVGTLTGAAVPAPPGQYFVRVRGVNACGPGAVSPELRVVVP